MTGHALLVLLLALPTGVAGTPPPAPRQAASSQAFRLTAIQVAGAKRYSSADVIKLSKLAIGQQVSPAHLDAAVARMTATGLFTGVSYRYVTLGSDLTLTLEIQEVEWTVPVVFDNFVWLTDEAIIAAVRREIPSFDGSAPSSAEFPDLLLGTLQNLLKARGIEGRAGFAPLMDLKTGGQQYVFLVRDPSPRLCDLRIEGASALSAAELATAARAGLPDEYSRFRMTNVANGTLRDLYRRRGYWHAAFASPAVSLERAAACTGVVATLRVDEGPAYAWDRAEWAGNDSQPSATLDSMLGMKAGDLADLSRIEAGLRSIHVAYGRQGYVLQAASFAPSLDDGPRRAVFQIRIVEGPQFRAGSVEFLGLPDEAAKTLLDKWRLRPGDVYDAEYLAEFVDHEILPSLRKGGTSARPPSVETQTDEQRRVVNVRLVFK